MSLPRRVTAGVILQKGMAFIDFGEQVASGERSRVLKSIKVDTQGIASARFQQGGRRLVLDLAHPSRTAEKAKALVMRVIASLSLELQGKVKLY